MMDGGTGQIRHPFEAPPEPGQVIEVAEGILWMRLPLPMQLDHVNCFALDDGDGWTVIDTGFNTRLTVDQWQALLAGPLHGRPVRRMIATHHHPDHIGLVGWFMAQGAELVTTRTAWLYARMLTLDVEKVTSARTMAFWRAAGATPAYLEERQREKPFNFADVVAPIPVGYTRIREGDTIRMGGRDWLVRTGDGHAPEHATFWSLSDRLVIGGDQLLPGISANIGVYPTEPAADPLGEWMDSCRRFQTFAREDQLILPGHKLPFTGLPMRLRQMVDNHDSALDRLLDHLETPHRAGECMLPLFKRDLTGPSYPMAMVETIAHLNYLLVRGLVTRQADDQGAWLWQRVSDDGA